MTYQRQRVSDGTSDNNRTGSPCRVQVETQSKEFKKARLRNSTDQDKKFIFLHGNKVQRFSKFASGHENLKMISYHVQCKKSQSPVVQNESTSQKIFVFLVKGYPTFRKGDRKKSPLMLHNMPQIFHSVTIIPQNIFKQV